MSLQRIEVTTAHEARRLLATGRTLLASCEGWTAFRIAGARKRVYTRLREVVMVRPYGRPMQRRLGKDVEATAVWYYERYDDTLMRNVTLELGYPADGRCGAGVFPLDHHSQAGCEMTVTRTGHLAFVHDDAQMVCFDVVLHRHGGDAPMWLVRGAPLILLEKIFGPGANMFDFSPMGGNGAAIRLEPLDRVTVDYYLQRLPREDENYG